MGNVEASMVVDYTGQEKFGDKCGVIIDVSGATATADLADSHLQVTRSLSVCPVGLQPCMREGKEERLLPVKRAGRTQYKT